MVCHVFDRYGHKVRIVPCRVLIISLICAEEMIELTIDTPVICDVIALIMTSL